MTDEKLIIIPDRGDTKYKILKNLYDEEFSKHPTELERFHAVNKKLKFPLSDRSWFRAKLKFDRITGTKTERRVKAKRIKEQKREFKKKSDKLVEEIKTSDDVSSKVPPILKKHIKAKPNMDLYKKVQSYINQEVQIPIVLDRTKKHYTDSERELILKNIFEVYSQGVSNLIKLCESQGIHHNTFLMWIDTKVEWRKEWDKVQKKHVLAFVRVFKEFYKEQKLKEMFNEEEEYWTINYTFVPAINPETQKAEMQMVPTTAMKHVRPRKLDNAVQDIFIEGMKEMYALETATELKVESEYDSMSLEDLLATQREILEELERKGDVE